MKKILIGEITMSELHIIDDNTLDEFVTKSTLPVFIDLWGDWCPPCKRIEPVIKELSDYYKEKMVFAKLNTDENPEISKKFEVMSIPMFLILNNKMELLDKFVGAIPKSKFVERIENSLKKLN